MNRSNFPIFENYKTKYKKDLIYLDNAATTQKLDSVIEKINEYYLNYSSNVHRGIYTISELATEEFESARSEIARFFNVQPQQVIFTSGTTDSLNIIARSSQNFDIEQIVTTELEHNSNILPFDRIKNEKLKMKIARINDGLTQNYENIERSIDDKKTLLTITGCSNVTGEIINIEKINKIKRANKDLIISLDAAQLIPHILFDPEFDIESLKLFDFISFSGHKVFGPTGIGVLIVNNLDLIDKLETNFGGGTVENIAFKNENIGSSEKDELEIKLKNSPDKFEAGTQNIAGAIGLGEVFKEINKLKKCNKCNEIQNHIQELAKYTFEKLNEIEELKFISTWNSKTHTPIFTFNINSIHPHDIAQYLNDSANICVRAGQHCTHLLHHKGNIKSSVRVSLSIYSGVSDIDTLIINLQNLTKILK